VRRREVPVGGGQASVVNARLIVYSPVRQVAAFRGFAAGAASFRDIAASQEMAGGAVGPARLPLLLATLCVEVPDAA
jgi:hypothetical protein